MEIERVYSEWGVGMASLNLGFYQGDKLLGALIVRSALDENWNETPAWRAAFAAFDGPRDYSLAEVQDLLESIEVPTWNKDANSDLSVLEYRGRTENARWWLRAPDRAFPGAPDEAEKGEIIRKLEDLRHTLWPDIPHRGITEAA